MKKQTVVSLGGKTNERVEWPPRKCVGSTIVGFRCSSLYGCHFYTVKPKRIYFCSLVSTAVDIHSNSCRNVRFCSRIANDHWHHRKPGLGDFQPKKKNKAMFLAPAQQTALPRVRLNTWDGLQHAAQHSGNIKMVRSRLPCSSCYTVVLLA